MKIVFYISSMAPAGGIERVLSQHISFLSSQNDVVLITDDANPSFYELPGNVKHISLNLDTELSLKTSKIKRIVKISATLVRNIKLLSAQFKAIKPDCVYTAHPLNLLKVVCSVRRFDRIFVTEHASITGYNIIYKKIALILYKRIKLLAVPTTLDSDNYRNYGIENQYLPNPLPFYPERSADLSSKTVLNVGRFTDDKQHLLLLELWAQSTAVGKGWILKIVGKGENYEKIIAKIEELNLQGSVQLVTPTKNIIDEYMEASIFMFTSRAEGFGLVLAEAMACGVPCISFNCPSGPRDIINDGLDGFLINVGDTISYVKKLDLLLQDTELRKKLGDQAKKSIKKFSGEIVSEKLNRLVNAHFKQLRK